MLVSRQSFHKTELELDNGIVTAMHPLAARAGASILERGGNAADAAIAAALAVGVVEPFMSGLGGCGYAVAFDAASGETTCFDGSGMVPREARPELYELLPESSASGLYGWRATKDDASETGYRAITVPGSPATFGALHEKRGRLSWEKLFEPAIDLAENGFPADEYFFAHTSAALNRSRPFPETMAIFYDANGAPRVPGAAGPSGSVRQSDLAGTFRRLARDGADSFYRGETARTIVAHVRDQGGILTDDDFASYHGRELEPLTFSYRGQRLVTLPQASGGPTVALAMNILEGFDSGQLSADTSERLHLLTEALRITYADRFQFMGDPDCDDIPYAGLASKDYAASRRALIRVGGPRLDVIPEGSPWDFQRGRPENPEPIGADSPHQHTTHVNAIDKDRNMVALTATLGARFGSSVTVPGLGIVLNNGVMWFDPVPGHRASIQPGKRALHAAAPILAVDGQRPVLAAGSPGARKIMSGMVQVLVNLLDGKLGIQESIETPRVHAEPASQVLVDDRLPAELVAGLRERGHPVEPKTESFLSSHFARPSGILVDEVRNVLRAGVEPFRVTTAAGH